MNKILRIFAVCIMLTSLFASHSSANYRMVTTIQKVFKTYNLPISSDQINIIRDSEGNLNITITTRSKRNTFEMVMLIGYISAGYAIKNTGSEVKQVNVIVTIPFKEDESIFTSASGEDVLKLINKEVSTAEFVSKYIKWK